MIITDIKCKMGIYLLLIASMGLARDGILLPMNDCCQISNKCVSVKIILAKDDPSLPQYMSIYGGPQSDFVAVGNATSAKVKVAGKIRIENNTDWPFEFGHQYMRSGYYNLEFDVKLKTGKIICMKKRRPKLLHEDGSSITLKPHWRWEYLVSFDRRLWDCSSEIITNNIIMLRPRFAYGVYNVDGVYYRNIDEIKEGGKNAFHFTDRNGELVGEWINYP